MNMTTYRYHITLGSTFSKKNPCKVQEIMLIIVVKAYKKQNLSQKRKMDIIDLRFKLLVAPI